MIITDARNGIPKRYRIRKDGGYDRRFKYSPNTPTRTKVRKMRVRKAGKTYKRPRNEGSNRSIWMLLALIIILFIVITIRDAVDMRTHRPVLIGAIEITLLGSSDT